MQTVVFAAFVLFAGLASAALPNFYNFTISPACMAGYAAILNGTSSSNPVVQQNVIQFLVSSGTYPGDMGDYLQCTGIQGAHFCIATLKFGDAFPWASDVNLQNETLSTGLCIPSACTSEDNYNVSADWFIDIYQMKKTTPAAFSEIRCLSTQPVTSAGAIICIFLLSVLLFLVALATGLSVLHDYKMAKRRAAGPGERAINDDEMLQLDSPTAGSSKKPKHKMHPLLGCFDLFENIPEMFRSPAVNDGFKSLEGLRVLSICWIITGHTFLHMESISSNVFFMSRDAAGWLLIQFLSAATFAVDTFFFLSGFLAAHLFLESFSKAKKKAQETGRTPKDPPLLAWSGLIYFHRYLRLTPLYLLAIMFWTYVLPVVTNGPFWQVWQNQVNKNTPCHEYWWTNVLYINNLYPNQFSGNKEGGLGCMAW